MSRLFACDLDGTLYNWLHVTDHFILSSIRKVLKSGNYFTIATGRNMHTAQLKAGFKNIGIHCICMNGARVTDASQNVIYEKWIDKKYIQELLERFPDIPFEFNTRNTTYVCCSEEEFKNNQMKPKWHIRFLRQLYKSRFVVDYQFNVCPEKILNEDIFKINFALSDVELKQKMKAYIEKNKSGLVNAPFMAGDYFELTDASVNKGKAIQILADSLHIDTDHVSVYGDGYNDLVMLKQFQHAFVPSNGCDEAKALAEKVLASNVVYSVPRHILRTIKRGI